MNIAFSTFLVIATIVGILELYGFFLLFFDYSDDADSNSGGVLCLN
jgi:hypothetical protein